MSSNPKVMHNVVLALKEDATKEEINKIFQTLVDFKEKNLDAGIVSFTWGPYQSHEGLNNGFNYGFSIVFESIAARDAYIPHPEHDRVKSYIVPCLKDGLNSIVAFDWYLNGSNEF